MKDYTHKINTMIENKLKKEGYKGLGDIRFSLGHCQGDGIAFYGYVTKNLINDLHLPYLERFINYKNDVKLKTAYPLEDYNVSYPVKKSQVYSLYDHCNTMIVHQAEYADLEYFIYEVLEDIVNRVMDNNELFFDVLMELLDDDIEVKEIIEWLDYPEHDINIDELANWFMDEIKDNKNDMYINDDLSELSQKLTEQAYNLIEK
jgi:hypothetical protein